MQREEKLLEIAVDSLIARVNDLKASISTFMLKLEREHETLNWPTVLDNYALISGQLNSLLKTVKNDKTPMLRNLILLPLLLSPDKDEELLKLTEGRVPALSHDVVPDYLRTKADPDVEAKEQQLHLRATSLSHDMAQKQINNMNKIVNNVLETINTTKADWESEANSRMANIQTCNVSDTHSLICAVSVGKSLKGIPGKVMSGVGSMGPMGMPGVNPGLPGQSAVGPQSMMNNPIGPGGMSGKGPGAIKTNIKAANAIHPYSRN